MNDIKDVIQERMDAGLCPICKKPINKDSKVIIKDKKHGAVWGCPTHKMPEEK